MTFDEYAIFPIIILAGVTAYFLSGWLGINEKKGIVIGLIKNFLILFSTAFFFAMYYFFEWLIN